MGAFIRQLSNETTGGFRAMTYNTLAQLMCSRKQYPTNGEIIRWKNRFPVLKNELVAYHPDLLFMQEIDLEYLKEWATLLKYLNLSFRTSYYPGKKHGVLIAWNSSLFENLQTQEINFDDYDTPFSPQQTRCVGLLCVLKSKQGDMFVVGTTHLFWRPEADYERLRQFSLLLDAIQRLLSCYKTCSVIIGADFNSTPDSPMYKSTTSKDFAKFYKSEVLDSLLLMDPATVDSEVKVDELLEFANKSFLKLESVYYEKLGNEPAFTNWTDTFRETLDYIFIWGPLKVVGVLELPGREQMGPEPSSLPRRRTIASDCYPSDHLAIMACLLPTTKINRSTDKTNVIDEKENNVEPKHVGLNKSEKLEYDLEQMKLNIDI